jgi:hypothetical protein
VIYYYVRSATQIRMLLIYDKAVVEDLTASQKKFLRRLNQNWK